MKSYKLVPFSDLKDRYGIPFTRRHILTLEGEKKFPARVPVGENRVAWVEAEVQEWLNQKIVESRQ